jgi:hypothetical protein
VGWLKTAEVLLNPLGEDVDDFDVNWILDRNIEVMYLVVDTKRSHYCPLVRDQFWHMDATDIELPHTEASLGLMSGPMEGSAEQVR